MRRARCDQIVDDLRDFQGVQDLLNAMFQRQVYKLVSVAQVSINAAAA